ncbi:MAG: glycine--tRNA ligase subunit beta [Candidatus Rokubacteria bacterium]|nr:glycine--tRNA ligase subunit beta [Candidatus Rokubacteria bacterium]
MSHTLLFELGTEELPPSELPTVIAALEERAARDLREARLGFESLRVFSTPRRLAVSVTGLDGHQAALRTRIIGPPRKAAFDATGKPTRAAEGFARSQGVTVGDLLTINTERGDYLAVEREEPGRPAVLVLPDLLTALVGTLPFAKQMRWGGGEFRFSRPIRWIVALLDDEVLPLTVAGVASGRVTYGHRFLAPEPITIDDAKDWAARLTAARVMPDLEARRDTIRTAVEAAAERLGLRAVVDEATLETVLHLVEAPSAIVGSFAETYLDLPRQVVQTPIRHHQRCFVVETADGRLAPYFVAVSNMPGVPTGEIRRGNERVIRARLADADFYFREDLETRPEERLGLLAGMVFQERLGTLREKTDRLVALVEHLAGAAPTADRAALSRAAMLAKTDLASGMVREFPELEGVIGAEYARRAGEPQAVATAIAGHYQPRTAEGALPGSLEGAVLAVADKLDTVVGCIGVGLMPSGSQDPYALRRHVQGVLQIAIARRDFALSLPPAVDRALDLLAPKLTEPAAVTRDRVLDVFRARLGTLLTGRGRRADVVEAVLASGFDEPAQVLRRVDALTSLLSRPDWEPLVITFKRTINILPAGFRGTPDPARFVHPAERQLHDATDAVRGPVEAALKTGDYGEALARLAGLRPVVDAFFDAVMVMDKDAAVQANRLGVLKAIADLLLPVADLRKIQPGPAPA